MAAKLLKLRRGTTTQHDSFTGAEGEVTVDLNKDVLVVHDGSTQAGHPLAAEDMSNVSSAHIAGRLATDSIATSKIAAGTLPSDVKVTDSNVSGNLTITSADIVDETIATGDIANNAVTFAKVENIAPNQVIGRINSGTGNVEPLTPAHVRTIINVENGATGDQTAAEIRTLVESASDSNVFTDADHTKLNNIQSGATDDQTSAEIKTLLASNKLTSTHLGTDSVTSTQIATNAVGSSELADDAVDTAAIADNAVTAAQIADSTITATQIAASTIGTGRIANDAITFAKMQNIAQDRLIGRTASGSGDATDLTATQARALLNVADGATNYTSNQATDTTSNVNFASVTASGNVTAFSDATLKTDIHTINEALGIVGKLRGVTYKWLSNGEADIGVIAQEVQEVVPEVIKETVDGIKTVDYGRLVSVLINAVNELNEKLDKHIEGGK